MNHRSEPEASGESIEEARDRSEADAIARLVRLAGSRPAVPPERALRAELAVREAWKGAVAARRRRLALTWGGSIAVAATLALAIGLAFRGPQVVPVATVAGTVERVAGAADLTTDGAAAQPLLAGEQLVAGSGVVTSGDGRVAVRLASGASLRLDVGSRLTFQTPTRLLLEGGAVYVDSQGGPPVTVATPLGTVEERGTQFEVRLAPAGVRVRVREGAVNLTGDSGSWDGVPGEELLLSRAGVLSRRTIDFHGEAWSWVQEIAPAYQLEGRTLGDFLAWFGRETGRGIRWSDVSDQQRSLAVVLHGSVDGLSPEQALAAVLPTCGLAHRLEGGAVTLFPNRP
jgi:ferric-dicitrate binding protein FerR (iron transport regulator)